MNINEKKEKFDSAIFRAYTDLVDNTLGYHDFDGKLKIQSITSLDLYTGDDNSDERISFNREVITSGKLKYNTLEEAKNSIKMFKTFCDNYLLKFEKNTGIPFGGSEIHSMMLMVSKERFIIDNMLYPYNEAKYNKILDIINFNENLLRETMSMQTEEYMSKHISYDNTSKILYVDNNINYKINCNTGDLSDEEINVKIIKPIEKIIREPLPEELSKLNSESNNIIFKKRNENDIIWWVDNHGNFGTHEFSFDQVKIYNLFRDYPYKLSPEEIEIFDRENPYWADFFKTRKQNLNNNQLNQTEDDNNLEKIKELYFKNNEEYFNSIYPYLNETFDYDILSGALNDNCVRFELFDKLNNKIAFFAINKNLFLLNYRFKHKMNLRGNSSDEIFNKFINDLKAITQSWNLDYSDDGEFYWGLTLVQDNKCNLYVGKSISVVNWNELSNVINNIIGELLTNISRETSI